MGCGISKKFKLRHTRSNEINLKSAILIQQWYRRYLKRLEMRRECAWTVFQTVEYFSEQNQLKFASFFKEIIDFMSKSDINEAVGEKDNTQKDEDASIMTEKKISATYDGPHLNFPLTKSQVENMVYILAQDKVLHSNYLSQILDYMLKKLQTMANVRHATTMISRKITVVGDLHGNLEDLIQIFFKNGYPAKNNPYIFNGDFVDRGENSIEICVLIFSYFLLYPNEVFINRGNHEDPIMNLRYGFLSEINKKYKHGKRFFKMFARVFSWLPLATVVDNKIFVLHGGISSTTDLQYLSTIERQQFLTLIKDEDSEEEAPTPSDTRAHKQVCDLLWSDPRDDPGCTHNEFRGGGTCFGPDVTKAFLEKYRYQLIIRSHECKSEGYDFTHNGQVCTLFSASNYYGPATNKGAYLKLYGTKLDRHFVQFSSQQGSAKETNLSHRIDQLEQIAIKSIWEKVATVKHVLRQEFEKFDSAKCGTIKPYEWFTAMQNATGLKLPWISLLPKMAVCDTTGNVLYSTTFDQFKVCQISEKSSTINEQVYQHKELLESLFRMIDLDNSGYITEDEFMTAFKKLNKSVKFTMTVGDIKEMLKSMDVNKDDMIDFQEFLQAFASVDKQ